MNSIKIIILLLIFLFFPLSGFSQNQATQKYIYKNDIIKINVFSGKTHFSQKDTIVLIVTIENISTDDIYVFKNPYLSFQNIDDTIDNNKSNLFINYGGVYSGGLETLEEMLVLSSYEKKKWSLKLPADVLLSKNYKNFVNVFFGLGYIENLKKINEYKNLSDNEIEIKKNTISLSSIIVYAALTKELIEVFGIYLK